MNHADLVTLLDFHYWARDRMLAAVDTLTPEQYTKDLGNSFKSVRDTVVHIYFAEWIWHARWMGTSPAHGLNAKPPPHREGVAAAADCRRGIGAPSVPGAGDACRGEQVLLRACIAQYRERLDELDIVVEAHPLRGGISEGEIGDALAELAVHGRHGLVEQGLVDRKLDGVRRLCGAYINHEDFESRLRTTG